ncbi:MAG: HlyD family efflux transporter periplasmic adaptor subunit [Geminocystis sp.]|nr:HlyD family efflux transporter periplasmic adaptor subunit [Geminocystis sp.]HIK38082.1 HlyD family efflux transporter periplasmic adaptor subunit [Geminocystis sp. M7585_C2015_104]MCS7149061.1 HlyD family efflux transporter periplasmic adaptor subunit [Geminocystis sp.]MCX8077422.1 HlyD family efflux transporter periplasmic adaptor subunit [Geminocystis sp.]MDW8117138.1 HlyD family efflux transporter periplasmic adaptor subunit [Geminocystis sp.]
MIQTDNRKHERNGKESIDDLSSASVIYDSNQKEDTQEVNLDLSGFDQDVVLRPTPVWSRATAWSLMGVTVCSIVWAATAEIEQVVMARGQLKPKGTVKEIQAPLSGVVREVKIKDGQHIKQGQTLVVFDSEASRAQLQSLEKIKNTLLQENKFYRALTQASLTPTLVERELLKLNLPAEISALALNRAALVAENQLFEVFLGENKNISALAPEEKARLDTLLSELNSRALAAKWEITQWEHQLSQNQARLNNARQQLREEELVLKKIEQRNRQAIAKAEEILKIDQNILNTLSPLAEEGALAKLQLERQKQRVMSSQKEVIQLRADGEIERKKQQQQIQNRLAEIRQLEEENERIVANIRQSQQKYKNALDVTRKEIRERLAENLKRLADIDSQINKLILENEKKIAELNGQISVAKQTIKYQELKAPVSGVVFDLKANPGFVPKTGQGETLLKIVPDPGPENPLVAEVYVTNKDIGFVEVGQKADVRIDAFPYSEFGDIKGRVYFVGSDALEPNQIYNFYRFPVKIDLESQKLIVRGQPVDLQSGMSVTVNIKVREKRTVLSLFTEQFTKGVETLKQVR